MTSNGDIPSGDAEMAECDGEEVVTMMDVLKEQQEFEDDANAVLGGSDEKECTYSQGYIKRQAIYACMTCCPESKDDPSKRAGFCLACSLSCHENHDLVELYTKRNFRCDCGNPKFKSSCQFTPNKLELNTENIYNQNFIGLYCSCSKPYGDQESTLDDEMIQCIICEDWWHATHLDAVVPAQDQYSEMICKLCMAKNEFLHDYSDLTINVESGDVDVVKVNGVDNMETDKLTNGSDTEETPINGTDEKLTNGSEEGSVEIETVATEGTNEAITENEGDAEKENINTEQLENETVKPKEPEENADAPMDTDDTDKASEVLPEINSEDKLETTTADQADSSAPEKSGDSTVTEKLEETNDLSERTDGNEPQERTEESSSAVNIVEDSLSADNNTDAKETAGNAECEPNEKEKSQAPQENDEGAAQAGSETITENIIEATQKSSKSMDTNECNIPEELEKISDAEKLEDNESLETSPNVEIDKSNESNNKTNITTYEAKAISQDEQINEVSKDENEIESKEGSDNDTCTHDAAKETSETKSTNLIESDWNNKVPELVSTENKRKIDDVDNISAKKFKLDDSKCLRPKGVKKVHKGATFWPSTFRQKLCTCNECIEMYKDLSVLFLTDLDDTVFAYETLGKERTAGKPNQYEKGMEALCSLGRIQQIDALTEYNKMRDKLLSFLQSFKDKKEIVTEHDIKTFFAGMKPEKRTDGVYFCG